jgi:hypothetical protein
MHVMAKTGRHLVVDGSNLATEGRTLPSLAQLIDAVDAVMAEDADMTVTVIVDATFAHRIDDSEKKAFEEASDNGEILMPPAGAVGRGDAFILQVAEKAGATVLSNDSFQEFHGEHPWLFDEGRLIGGKPIDGIGWVFVDRVPVRGPASRRATRGSRKSSGSSRKGSKSTKKSSAKKSSKALTGSTTSGEPLGPAPKPDAKSPPPRRSGSAAKRSAGKNADDRGTKDKATTASKKAASRGSGRSKGGKDLKELNSPSDFTSFVFKHSIGDEVEAVVDRFSSHGCYVRSEQAQCYLPSSAMGDPPPSRARDVVSVGQTVIVKVESLDSDRRGINVTLVRTVADDGPQQSKTAGGPSRRRKQDTTSQQPVTVADESAGERNPTRSETTVAKKTAKKATAKKATKKATKKAAKKAASKKAPAKATPSKRAAKATAKKAAKKATKKATAKKAAKKTTKKAAKKATAKKAAKKATKKATAKKSAKKATKKATAKKSAKKATKKATAKKAAKKTTKKATKKATAKRAAKKA